MGLREFLQLFSTRELAEEHPGSLCSWTFACHLEPFKKLACTGRRHGERNLNYDRNWTAIAAVESRHSKLQLARSRARDFRHFGYFRTIA